MYTVPSFYCTFLSKVIVNKFSSSVCHHHVLAKMSNLKALDLEKENCRASILVFYSILDSCQGTCFWPTQDTHTHTQDTQPHMHLHTQAHTSHTHAFTHMHPHTHSHTHMYTHTSTHFYCCCLEKAHGHTHTHTHTHMGEFTVSACQKVILK